MFCAENRSKKHQIFEKWDDFENRPSCKGYSPCEGFSLCKMVRLGENFKMRKTCQKPFGKNLRVVLCKKPLKNWKHQIFEKCADFENRPSCKGYGLCKGFIFCKMVSLGQKLKMPKTCQKSFWKRTLELFCAKNHSKKHQISKKWDDFENRASWKGYSPCKGFSLCKMVSSGQKLKMPKTFQKPFYKKIRVVLCKKALEKTPNIREILKIGHLGKALMVRIFHLVFNIPFLRLNFKLLTKKKEEKQLGK